MPTLPLWCLLATALAGPALPNTPAAAPSAATRPAEPVPAEVEAGAPTAAAGQVVFDVRQPAELLIDGVKLGQLYYAGQARFDIVPGRHVVRVYVSGQPTDGEIEVVAGTETRVLVGRTGLSISRQALDAPEADAVPVELRVVGGSGAQVRLDAQRFDLPPGGKLSTTLATGAHAVSFRSADGTVIWATGTLRIAAGDPIVVQLAEGRLPEISGPGRFDAGGG